MNGADDFDASFSLHGKNWRYRGEGNANLVLSLTEERKIVRFRKNGVGTESDIREEQERVWREAKFCRGVMALLLGSCYVESPAVGCIEPDELRHIDKIVQVQRPSHRHHKGLTLGHVMVYPDYAMLPPAPAGPDFGATTFCIEVKPKQGWLPVTDRRLTKCTYCLNQFLKLKTGAIQSRSSYCPLDLFSGNPLRMKSALKSLLGNPQNNLKIFRDGVLVYGDDVTYDLSCVLQQWFPCNQDRAEDKLCDLVLQALMLNMSSQDLLAIHRTPPSPLPPTPLPLIERLPSHLVSEAARLLASIPPCDWSTEVLPRGCILDRILEIQRLENDGSDRVYSDYMDLESKDNFAYVDEILKSDILSPIQRYLLATTAKDCSVMIAFRQHDRLKRTVERVVYDCDSQAYEVSVGVSDLDPKPLSCIEKHRKRDHDTLLACQHVLS